MLVVHARACELVIAIKAGSAELFLDILDKQAFLFVGELILDSSKYHALSGCGGTIGCNAESTPV